ncbi:transposase [Nitrosomonas communis]|uniref:transposase n=1 Tax=Nitrosomonas communis TaxID=44574 RepID=UPI000943440A|nr:transposase [Nitrosomonas communis]
MTLKILNLDGTTHIFMSPLEFMQRLAVLVLQPRLNLIRYHHVLAPNAKLHPEIIPDSKKNKNNQFDTDDDAPHSPASVCISWAHLLKWVFDIDIEHCDGTLNISPPSWNPVQSLKFLTISARPPERRHVHLCRSRVFSIPSDSWLIFFSTFHD